MRTKLTVTAALVIACIGYIVAPFYTAWSIKEAAKKGHAHVLARSVYWPTVKTSLKKSMRKLAGTDPQTTNAALQNKGIFRKLWTRIKSSFANRTVDSLVERYANPTGFAKVFGYGRSFRKNVQGLKDPEDGLPLFAKIKAVWARVQRAEFQSLTRFELDLRDKFDANRVYCGVLELKGLRWMLTEVEILESKTTGLKTRLSASI